MNYNKHWYNSNEMQKQQIETALFASVAGKHDTPLDEHFSGRHVHPTTIKHLNEHMDDFYDKAQQHLQPHEDDNLLGHNFLLARNGHGAGYFDKYYQNGDKLYKLAKKYPEVHLYPGIDGMVHHHGSSENVPEDHKFGRDEDDDEDDDNDDFGYSEPKGDGPKGGHALKVPEYQLAYSRAIQYSFKRPYADLNTLVRNIHADPHNNLHHGVLADYISEHHPEAEPIAHLIRQYSEHVPPMEHLKQVENDNTEKGYNHVGNMWSEPWIDTKFFTHDTHYLGRTGPFALSISHAPGNHFGGHVHPEHQRFVIHAHTDGRENFSDPSKSIEYNFEFPSHNTKEIDSFIHDLASAHPHNQDVAGALLHHIHGI